MWLRRFLSCLLLLHALLPVYADSSKTNPEWERKRKDLEKRHAERVKEMRKKFAEKKSSTPSSKPATGKPISKPSLDHGVDLKSNSTAYRPKQNTEYVYQVTFTTDEEPHQYLWTGPWYLRCLYPPGYAPAEVMSIASLKCYRIDGEEKKPVPDRDLHFRRAILIGETCVYDTKVASVFDKHTLPLQMSALIPAKELLIPSIPMFTNSKMNDSISKNTYYITGSPTAFNPIGEMESLDGESKWLSVMKSSAVSERTNAFYCAKMKIGFQYKQTTTHDSQDGLPRETKLEYLLKWNGSYRAKFVAKRIDSKSAGKAKEIALKSFPYQEWPSALKRVPVPSDYPPVIFLDSLERIRPGTRVICSLPISTSNVQSSRRFFARIEKTDGDRATVLLEGSKEKKEIHRTSLSLAK